MSSPILVLGHLNFYTNILLERGDKSEKGGLM